MVNQAYITLMGRSGWGVVNSFHATIIETDYRPEQIRIVYEAQLSNEVKPVIRGLEIIQSSYTTPNVEGIEVPNWDAHAAGTAALELVRKHKQRGFETALDITGGRKALVTGALLALKKETMKHVFYLAIDTTEGVAKPYLMIPRRIQRLYDILTNEIQSEKAVYDPATGETDLRLTRDCVTVLLNQAYARGEKISVKAPLIGVDILDLDLQKLKVVMKTDKSNYEEKMRFHEYENSDHPTYWNLRRCLGYCGILDYENENEFRDLLVTDLSKTYDTKSRARRSFLALDSNMFYSGFPLTLMKLESNLGIQSKDVLCVTPYAVRKEIQRRIKKKYRKHQVDSAKNHYRAHHLDELIEEFRGQSMFETREAKMARSQVTGFGRRPVHMMTRPIDDLPRDSEEVDQIIVDSLEQFARERRVRVQFVSTDKDMYERCDGADDVYPLILSPPVDIPRTMAATDQNFVDLLIGLSLLYGVVELGKIGYLFGEYKGKKSEVYMNEVKLRLRNLQRAKVLGERTETCQKLMKLNIHG